MQIVSETEDFFDLLKSPFLTPKKDLLRSGLKNLMKLFLFNKFIHVKNFL